MPAPTPAPTPETWTWRVFNLCTWSDVAPAAADPADAHATADEATRAAQAWLLAEADAADSDADATALDHAAQALNHATTAMVGAPFEWEVSVIPVTPPPAPPR